MITQSSFDESSTIALGFDFGTSGARCCAVTAAGDQVEEVDIKWASAADAASPGAWLQALDDLLFSLPKQIRARVDRVCVGGTSSSCLLVDGRTGLPSRACPGSGRRDADGARMYDWGLDALTQAGALSHAGDDDEGRRALGQELCEQAKALLDAACPPGHTARAGTSTLAKLAAWALDEPLGEFEVLAHQSDFVAAHLWSGLDPVAAASIAPTLLKQQKRGGGDRMEPKSAEPSAAFGFISDWHNALKLGFDVSDACDGGLRYPDWMVGSSECLAPPEPSSTSSSSSSSSSSLAELLRPRSELSGQGRRRGSQQARIRASPLAVLPRVVEPGTAVGPLSEAAVKRWGLGQDLSSSSSSSSTTESSTSTSTTPSSTRNCQLVLGTTDSIAAFLASGVSGREAGTAVTSLGSTLAVKLLSNVRLDDSAKGIYSHRFGTSTSSSSSSSSSSSGGSGGGGGASEPQTTMWLVGGASNVGCAVLRSEGFSGDEIARLSRDMDPGAFSGSGARRRETAKYSGYYPLVRPGERFPVADPKKQPVLDPKPEGYPDRDGARREYLQAIFDGIARVEEEGYACLREMGASPLTEVLTAGGGSVNPVWTEMRAARLGVSCSQAPNTEASYGLALLANRDR